jgi:hypothetical protein
LRLIIRKITIVAEEGGVVILFACQDKLENLCLGLLKTKNPDSEKNQDFEWCHQESNRGHKDFQSFALPTELWHQCVVAKNFSRLQLQR